HPTSRRPRGLRAGSCANGPLTASRVRSSARRRCGCWASRRTFSIEADNDTDHVIAVFKIRGHWGAIAKSNYANLEYREPIHRTLRELAISYFPGYFNLRRERTLRTFSRPVNLGRFDRLGWMTSEKDVWYIPEHLLTIAHTRLVPAWMAKRLYRLDDRSWKS